MNRPRKKGGPKKPKMPPDYIPKIQAMTARANAWVALHPELSPKIQWNYPQETFLSAPISQAVELHFLSLDETGRDLLNAMIKGFIDEEEPSAFQVRIALETLDLKPPGLIRSPCPTCGAICDDGAQFRDKGAEGPVKMPRPNVDPVVCIMCGDINLLDDGRQLRAATAAELADFQSDPQTWDILAAAQKAIRNRQ